MLLRNYYNALASVIFGQNGTDVSTFGDGHLNVKKGDGTIKGVSVATLSNFPHFNLAKIGSVAFDVSSFTPNNTYVMFGTGNAAVTFDDYCLDNLISSGLAVATLNYGGVTYNSTTEKFEEEVTFVLTNSGSSSKTISEIGIAIGAYLTNSVAVNPPTASAAAGGFLAYREVLSTPFTIAAGENVTYTHKFEFTMPTV